MTSRPALRVEADLRVDIDGVPAQVVGHGDEVHVVTDDPARLWRAALRSAPSAGRAGVTLVRHAVGSLADSGVTLVVPAPSGVTLRLGADVRPSPVGRLTGSPHVQVDLGPRGRRVTTVLVGATAAVVAFAALRRSRG